MPPLSWLACPETVETAKCGISAYGTTVEVLDLVRQRAEARSEDDDPDAARSRGDLARWRPPLGLGPPAKESQVLGHR